MELFLFLLMVGLVWTVLSQRKQFKKMNARLTALEKQGIEQKEVVNESKEPLTSAREIDSLTRTDQKAAEEAIVIPRDVNQVKPAHSSIKSEKVKPPRPVPEWRKNLFSVESIISKLGILLLLIGVGFIFRLAYDNGYITEELAVFMGGLIGVVILYLGYRVHKHHRPVLSQVLYGGGIATLYITCYAAYQAYGLIPGVLALMFMCAITALAFVLAVISNSVAMSVIAILGGLMTPFVLQLEQLGLYGTGIYVLMMAIAATSIYVVKRWRLLQLSIVVGAYLVTGYFITLETMTQSDKVALSLLILALLLLFNGSEYLLSMMKLSSTKFPLITYGLFMTLPVVSWLEIQEVLDLSDTGWSISFVVTFLVFGLLASLLTRLEADEVVTNIALSFSATFATFAAVLYFGGDVQVIAVAILGLMYYGLSKRLLSKYVLLLGHLLIFVAFVLGLFELVEGTYNNEMSMVTSLVRLLVTGLLLAGALMNKGQTRKIIAGLTLGVYGLIALQLQVYDLSKDWEPIAVMVVVHGLYLALLLLVDRKSDWLPKVSFIPLALLPVLLKLVLMVVMAFTDEVNGYEIGAFVLYGLGIYLLAHFLMKEDGLFRLIFKTVVYTLAFMLLLADLVVGSDSLLYGVMSAGVFLFVLQYLDSDREGQWLSRLRFIYRSLWFLLLLVYLMMTLETYEFDVLNLIVDAFLLIVVWLNLRNYKVRLPMLAYASIMTGVYAIIVYKNLNMLAVGSGVITLLWAAFAIGLLIYSVVKAHKNLVTYSLVLVSAVAAKFVLADLASVTTLWKIIISMGFGTALLVLSYFLQPILSGIVTESEKSND